MNWDGRTLDSFPMLLNDNFMQGIVVTSEKSPYTDDKLDELMKRLDGCIDQVHYGADSKGFYYLVPLTEGSMDYECVYCQEEVIIPEGAERIESMPRFSIAEMTLVYKRRESESSWFYSLYFADANGKLYKALFYDRYGYADPTEGSVHNVIWYNGVTDGYPARFNELYGCDISDSQTPLSLDLIAELRAKAEDCETSPKTGNADFAPVAFAAAIALLTAISAKRN